MKKLLLLVMTAVWIAGGAFAQSYVNTDAAMPGHPRIMLLKGEEKTLLKKIKKDPYWLRMHNDIIGEAGRIAELPLSERIVTGRRLLSVSRENLRRIFMLSYAYRMTGDKKFAARGEQELVNISGYTDWNPSHYLDVAEMTMAVAIGYDWLYDRLSPASRETIKKAILEKGLKTSQEKRYNSWLNAEHNWNQVCNAGITFGALATYEDHKELSVELINRAIESIKKPMKEYAPDGAYPEGIGYWSYGTSFNVMFLTAVQKVYNSDFGLVKDSPGFLGTGMYSQVMITPSFHTFNYADNGNRAGFNSTVFWFYSQTKDPALLYLQKKLFERDARKRFLGDRLLPAVMIWGAGSDASLANPEVPRKLSWMGEGPTPVMAARSSWSDTTALYLGFKAGSPSVNHAHMDVGSFIFEADGIRWAVDFGAEDYNRLETRGVTLWDRKETSQRWDVFRYQTKSHNTLAFNDKPQKVAGYAKIDAYAETANLIYAMSDLSELYKSQIPGVKRAVSMVDKRYAVIQDQLTCSSQFTKVRWNMLTEAERVTETGNNTLLLEKNGKKLYVKVESPVPVRFYNEDTTPTNTYDSPNSGNRFIGFEADLERSATQVIRVYLMPREMVANPQPGYQFK